MRDGHLQHVLRFWRRAQKVGPVAIVSEASSKEVQDLFRPLMDTEADTLMNADGIRPTPDSPPIRFYCTQSPNEAAETNPKIAAIDRVLSEHRGENESKIEALFGLGDSDCDKEAALHEREGIVGISASLKGEPTKTPKMLQEAHNEFLRKLEDAFRPPELI